MLRLKGMGMGQARGGEGRTVESYFTSVCLD